MLGDRELFVPITSNHHSSGFTSCVWFPLLNQPEYETSVSNLSIPNRKRLFGTNGKSRGISARDDQTEENKQHLGLEYVVGQGNPAVARCYRSNQYLLVAWIALRAGDQRNRTCRLHVLARGNPKAHSGQTDNLQLDAQPRSYPHAIRWVCSQRHHTATLAGAISGCICSCCGSGSGAVAYNLMWLLDITLFTTYGYGR